jgi:tetratricopeptide (TPR) repeat protein
MKKAMRLNPRYSPFYSNTLGLACLVTKRYDEAIATLKETLARNPNWMPAHGNLAVTYSELGRQEEARAEVAEVLRLSPNLSVEGLRQRLPFKDRAQTERYLGALRKAGLK